MPKVNLLEKDMTTNAICERAGHAGIEVMEMGRRAGIKKTTLYKRLNEPETMSLGELRRIAKAVGGFTVQNIREMGIKIIDEDKK